MSYLLAYNPYNTNLFMRTRSIDPAAQDFIDAAGITGDVQQQAINNLVKGLKADGLWSKMKAVYPFVTDNRNLLSYTNTLTQTSYWNQVSVTLTGGQTDPIGGANATRIVGTGAASLYGLITLTTGATYTLSCYVKSTSGSNQTFRIYANGGVPFSPNLTATSTWQQVTLTFTALAGIQSFGITRDSSNNNYDILAYGIQMELGSTATTYQPIATTQQAYIASQFKYNLVNPVDSDAAFRLVFNGGWTHSSNGALPNGTNGYADTKFIPTTNFNSLNDKCFGLYVGTNTNNGVEMGALSGGYVGDQIVARNTNLAASSNSNLDPSTSASTDSRGFWLSTRSSSLSGKYYKNSTSIITLGASVSQYNNSMFLGARRLTTSAEVFSDKRFQLALMGDGLTDDDAAALYYHTQVFQTSLNRQIGSPAYAIPVITDPNAKLYLSAIGSTTNSTFNTAIDTFIKGLKADGIYSKMKAVYPFATNNPNLLSYTENLSNAIWSKDGCTIIANNTIAPDGSTTAWRITRINSGAQGFAIRQLNLPIVTSTQYTFSVYLKAPNSSTTIQVDLGDGVPNPVITLTTEWQLYTFVRTLGGSGTFLDFNIGSGDGSYCWFWHPQLEIGSVATAYQPQLVSAQTYFANQFKYNMVNPQDDDSAFRLVFNGGWTHSPQGALPNGVNGYADTKFNQATYLTQTNGELGAYLRTNIIGAYVDIGSYHAGANFALITKLTDNNFYGRISTLDINSNYQPPTTLGLFAVKANGTNSAKFTRNGVTQATRLTTTFALESLNIGIGAGINPTGAVFFSPRQTAFNYISDSLTDTEAANLYTRVQNLQTLLNRQV